LNVVVGEGSTEGTRAFAVDLQVFSLTAVRKTAYRFIDRFAVDVHLDGPQTAIVQLTPKTNDAPPFSVAEADFRNELIDQDLRERIYAETEPYRRVLLAHALSRVPILDADLEQAAYEEDPSLER
jgi:His-Xaa-Ser system protein HxsD